MRLLTILFVFIPSQLLAYSFEDAVKRLKNHSLVSSVRKISSSIESKGEAISSWGDPMFKVAAKNYPKDTLNRDQTPMTGIEFSISKKISLTPKYSYLEDSFKALSRAKKFESDDQERKLIQLLWYTLIEDKKLSEEKQIIEENLEWITQILKVSKKLYANGKISQQDLLDVQIRKSELSIELNNKIYEKMMIKSRLVYLVGENKGEIDQKSIPWKILGIKSNDQNLEDVKIKKFESIVISKEEYLTARKLSYISDPTISFGYTKRANIDKQGDFVSASISFPLPLTTSTFSSHKQASFEKNAAIKKLEDYKIFKKSEVMRLNDLIKKIEKEIEILDNKTIKFARGSKKITSKSYGLGRSSYGDLLKTELKLQNLLLRRTSLSANLNRQQVAYKYLIGDKLHE
jgi:outer membrane protein TolC